MSAEQNRGTLVDILLARANEQADDVAYTFMTDGESRTVERTYAGLARRATAIAASLQQHGSSGTRVLLVLPPGLEYVEAFFGCLCAGAVAVPVYPPRRNQNLDRLRAIARDAGASIVLTTAAILNEARGIRDHAEELRSVQWLASDTVADADSFSWKRPMADRGDLAFLQYTSGSTRSPRGVMVSHANLLHNQRAIQQAMAHPDTRLVSWLPLYHDMGLIGGIIQPLCLGRPCIFMSPGDFLQRPLRWLAAISRYRATTSGAPNFAYDLCVRKIRQADKASLDLSCWRVAFNGAEPVQARTLDQFAEAFAECGFRRDAFFPCYGLAESTLFVSGGGRATGPRTATVDKRLLERHEAVPVAAGDPAATTLVSSGETWFDQRVVIVDPETRKPRPDGRVGEIWISGPSVAEGYWQNAAETADTFGASLDGDDESGPFLRSGDLGLVMDGHLYVTGRLKDTIIIWGANHYPHDIERTVEVSHSALRPSGGAAFSLEVGGQEVLAIVQEVEARYQVDRFDDVIEAVRRAVAEKHAIDAARITLVRAGQVPKTSSGKTQRSACRSLLLAGELAVLAEWAADEGAGAGNEGRGHRTDHPDPRQGAGAIQLHLVKQVAATASVETSGDDIQVRRSAGANTRVIPRPDLATEFVAPRTELEQTIAGIWQQALDLDRVGVHDSFFDLGGDSMFAGLIVSQVNKSFGVSMQVREAFDAFTVARLAEHLEAKLVEKLESMGEDEVARLLQGEGG